MNMGYKQESTHFGNLHNFPTQRAPGNRNHSVIRFLSLWFLHPNNYLLGNYVNSQQVWVLAIMSTVISIRISIVCHHAGLLMAIIPNENNTILTTTNLFLMTSICTHDMEPLTAIYSNHCGGFQHGKHLGECKSHCVCILIGTMRRMRSCMKTPTKIRQSSFILAHVAPCRALHLLTI